MWTKLKPSTDLGEQQLKKIVEAGFPWQVSKVKVNTAHTHTHKCDFFFGLTKNIKLYLIISIINDSSFIKSGIYFGA